MRKCAPKRRKNLLERMTGTTTTATRRRKHNLQSLALGNDLRSRRPQPHAGHHRGTSLHQSLLSRSLICRRWTRNWPRLPRLPGSPVRAVARPLKATASRRWRYPYRGRGVRARRLHHLRPKSQGRRRGHCAPAPRRRRLSPRILPRRPLAVGGVHEHLLLKKTRRIHSTLSRVPPHLRCLFRKRPTTRLPSRRAGCGAPPRRASSYSR